MPPADPAAATAAATAATTAAADLDPAAVAELVALLRAGDVMVLTGAGVSTDSGIPDYRGPRGALRRHTPMTYQEFVSGPQARQRYWARSHGGWRTIDRAQPNAVHRDVARLQHRGLLAGIVTQNVDGLHQAGGAREVLELHGALDAVVCLHCRERTSRRQLDDRLAQANPAFARLVPPRDEVNPDGDVDLDPEAVAAFVTVACLSCGQDQLKPDVVFFGENVPKDRVERSYALVDACSTLLVLGSSLTVMSGYRFVRHAHKHGTPVAVVNAGPTRGDGEADLRLDVPLAPVLAAVVAGVDAAGPTG